MTLNQAFAIRVREYLKEKNMTQYKLEQSTGIYHSTMTSVLNNKTKASNFKTMALIIRALGVSVSEFFDSPVFSFAARDSDFHNPRKAGGATCAARPFFICAPP